ncbi:MAG: hypothetical protein JNK48_03760 [Bryobacterales bacterium]|nr:hypothetical protein [Bryobacterales bacterium]
MTTLDEVSAEEKRQALELALNSRTFSRAGQLKAFLRFVVEADIAGRGDELTEHVIGVEVLGRPTGYSPAEDSSVRTRAYELRQKLEKLYAFDIPVAPVHIVLPKGAYHPQFVRYADTAAHPASTAPPAPPSSFHGRPLWLYAVPALLGILAGVAVAWLALGSPQIPIDPVLAEAWAPFAGPNANVILCAATPLHLTVGPATHAAAGTPTYPAPPEAYTAFRNNRPLDPATKLGLLITDNVLGVGTMNAVLAASGTLRSLQSSFQVLPERVAPISSLRNRNAILFGAPVDSEAISRVLENAPLTIAYSDEVREFVVLEKKDGSKLVPKKDAAGEFIDVYGLITVLNNREADARRLGMVVFSGITSTGTQGAAEFFSSPRSMRELRARMGNQPFPSSYQVVVRCTFSNKLLLAYEYHSHRVL